MTQTGSHSSQGQYVFVQPYFSCFFVSISTKVHSDHASAAPNARQENYRPWACVLHIRKGPATITNVRTRAFKTGSFNSPHRQCKPQLHTPTKTKLDMAMVERNVTIRYSCDFTQSRRYTPKTSHWALCKPQLHTPTKTKLDMAMVERNVTIRYSCDFTQSRRYTPKTSHWAFCR